MHAGFSGPIGIIGLVAQGDHTTFKETRAFLVELRAQARQAFGSGKTVEQASAEIKLPDYAGWQGVADLSMPLRRLYAEFRGEL